MESLIAAAPALCALPEIVAKTRRYGTRYVAGARIIVEPDENYGKTAGGIFFETRERPQAGIIRMLGTGLSLPLAVGDRVTYSKYAGSPTWSPEEGDRLILAEKDVLTFEHDEGDADEIAAPAETDVESPEPVAPSAVAVAA